MADNLGGTNSGQKFNFSAAEAEELDGGYATTAMNFEQEKMLPIAIVCRIMKQILPGKARISKKAKEMMQECVSEFIMFVTEEARDICRKGNRRILDAQDVCCALSNLGLDNYADSSKRFWNRYKLYNQMQEKERSAAAAAADVDVR